ncbi:DNA primase [Haloplanus sp. GCM10025708]|uniref:DNA primase n=1 Tax=Haloferacaceae TaxID=1644056 RepID=UPI003618087F
MRPDPHHARYPFFTAAREAVQAAAIDPPQLVAEDHPAVERGSERVERALLSGTVASETPDRWRARDELLSYPVARVLVSLVDSPAAVEKYAAAEAATAVERFREDFERGGDGLRSVSTPRVDLDDVLREFGLDAAVDRETADRAGDERVRVDVDAYLRLSNPDWGDRWRLVNRELAAGRVRLERGDLYRLLEAAVRRCVVEGLPFDVRASASGEALADALEDEVATLRDLLSERDAPPARDVDTVAPAQFPPCVRALVERAREGDLPAHSAFSLTAFLTAIGMDADGVAAFCDLDPETVEYRVAVLEDGDDVQYPPPSCETMDAYGDCVNRDERCETVSNPLAYYAAALDDAEAVEEYDT